MFHKIAMFYQHYSSYLRNGVIGLTGQLSFSGDSKKDILLTVQRGGIKPSWIEECVCFPGEPQLQSPSHRALGRQRGRWFTENVQLVASAFSVESVQWGEVVGIYHVTERT